MIFESPDGGKTVYSREPLSNEKTLVYVDKYTSALERWYKWKEIIEASENCPALQNVINQAEVIYDLIKTQKG